VSLRYAKITARFGEKKKTFLVQLGRETAGRIYGMEVDREGSPIERPVKGTDGWSRHLIVFSRPDIIKIVPMRMNLHYGELEPDPDCTCGDGK